MSLPLGLPIGRLASSEPGHRTASESTRQPIGRVNPMVQTTYWTAHGAAYMRRWAGHGPAHGTAHWYVVVPVGRVHLMEHSMCVWQSTQRAHPTITPMRQPMGYCQWNVWCPASAQPAGHRMTRAHSMGQPVG